MESRERIGMSCFNRATGIVVRVTVLADGDPR